LPEPDKKITFNKIFYAFRQPFHFFQSLLNKMQEDLLLIEECKKKSNSAFEKLYSKYASRMKAIAFRYVGDSAKAEDVLHDAFIKVFEKIAMLENNMLFEGWLRRIVINEAIDFLKEEKKINAAITESGQLNSNHQSDNREHFEISAKELMNLLNELPHGYKTIFNMYVVDGYQHKEIAGMLGISEGTSKSQLAKAKEFLKKKLEKNMQLQ
jgi:RNA polymerase sigma factor (sigma-70 family)